MKTLYSEFLRSKIATSPDRGLAIEPGSLHPSLLPHQRAIVEWAIRGGRRAIFAAFGLGKTYMQLEILRSITAEVGEAGLIVAPLGVRGEFLRDAKAMGTPLQFIRSSAELEGPGIYLTNYESVREGKINPSRFAVTSLDEASVLRGMGGSKTFREFMRAFEDVRYRFVATATPSPNEFTELLAYAAYLGVMSVGDAKTRFFQRDSTRADALTLHAHKEADFWAWMSGWSVFLQKPSDLGFSDEGYDLPPLDIRWHELPSDYADAGQERDGQLRLVPNASLGVVDAAREKRRSMAIRVTKAAELVDEDPEAHFIIWHDLEDERRAIVDAIPEAVDVYGTQELEDRERRIADFSEGKFRILATKPVIAGSGCNFQRFCHRAVFLGLGYKFNDFIQAVHRLQRFQQTRPVRIDLIYTEAERGVRDALVRKWDQHRELTRKMAEIIREQGLSAESMAREVVASVDVGERIEVEGEGFRLVRNDCVEEAARLADDSIDMILTSPPFGNQYKYSDHVADFGHSSGPEEFFAQMDYLTPELFRSLKPGRIAAIHVKDRIVPGGINKLGFQTVYPFHAECINHFQGHGFAFLGMKTIVTDVVRENNQTYRLGWTEQCKDGSKMGVGMPEYLLVLRKPPSDPSNGYADEPVIKDKGHYSRARWQTDAHGFARSSGDRLVSLEEMEGLEHAPIFRAFKEHFLSEVYDYEAHVRLGERLEARGVLPTSFMLLQPPSWSDEVWSDVTRMLTLNTSQANRSREMHICPLQLDIVDRAITQYSQPGEQILDPFGGLMTVPYRALKLGRRGIGFELSLPYFFDGVRYCEIAAKEAEAPSLFDLLDDVKTENHQHAAAG